MKKSIVGLFVLLVSVLAHGQTEPFLSIEPLSAVKISFHGQPWTDYILQYTTSPANLVWSNAVTIHGNATGNYALTNVSDAQTMFYRTVAGNLSSRTGSVFVRLASTPTNDTPVYVGTTNDVAAYQLLAAGSDMAMRFIALDFDYRLWLYGDSIAVKNAAGMIVAKAANLSNADFTEINVGSDYRLFMSVDAYVLHDGQIENFTVSVGLLPTTSRASGELSLIQAQFISVDSAGVLDNEIWLVPRSVFYVNPGH